MDHGDCPVTSSETSDPQQRRPDGRMHFVETAEQSWGVDWQISDVVDWWRQRLRCSKSSMQRNQFWGNLDQSSKFQPPYLLPQGVLGANFNTGP